MRIDMRIVVYNILKGGEGRADPLAEVIEAQKADIVALIEADDLTVLDRIAGRLKMEVIHAPAGKHAVALLSRWPIVNSVNHGALWETPAGCLLEAGVRTTGGDVIVGVTQSEDPQDQPVADAFAQHRQAGTLHLVCGSLQAPERLLQLGYIDLLAGAQSQEAQASSAQPPRQTDAILAHGVDPSKVKSAWVEQDRLAVYASDHFPVGVEIDGLE